MSLDPAQDPDRFDASRFTKAPVEPPDEARPLDPAADPDRYDRTLPEMLGEGAHEQERVGLEWLYGLLAVLGFLVLVSLIVQYG